MMKLLFLLLLSGCTASTVAPGCSMERTATTKISCTKDAKDKASTITVPMP